MHGVFLVRPRLESWLKAPDIVGTVMVLQHVMADTLGSVGVIISTLLINRYGWTGFDPIASIFIAVLIFASVVPLVTESGRLLCLDIGVDHEKDVRSALAKVRVTSYCDSLHRYITDDKVIAAEQHRRIVIVRRCAVLAQGSIYDDWLDTCSARTLSFARSGTPAWPKPSKRQCT